MEQPDIPELLEACRPAGLAFELERTSFFLSRETYKRTGGAGLNTWQEWLFVQLLKTASDAAGFFNLPPGRVDELGAQVEI